MLARLVRARTAAARAGGVRRVSSAAAAAQSFFRLDGRVALVTGAGQSMGEAIARRLNSAGARVVLYDQNREAVERVAASLPRASAIAVAGAVEKEADVNAAVAAAEKAFGPVDVLVNNAGITGLTAPIWDLSRADLERVMAVNVTGPFLLCKAVIGRPAGADGSGATGMLARGYGRIVNIASIAGKEGNPTLIPYSASKAAVINLTKALAKEVAGRRRVGAAAAARPGESAGDQALVDICVNAIAPAVIRTEMVARMPKATVDYMISRIPMGRTGRLEEVAALAHFLSAAECSFTTGQCYDLSGGRATY